MNLKGLRNKAIGLGATALLLAAGSALGAEKKVLLVDSYHEGYAWSDSIVAGAKGVIGDKAEFKVFRMDTKRNGSEEAKKAAAEKVKQEIETWKPDCVIACDDNAAKYVIVPFYKDSKVPFVFCGINWDASGYGFPLPNVTGMLEVSVISPLMDQMKKYAKGEKVGFIGCDNETDHKEADNLNKKFNLNLNAKFVKTFDDWKASYKQLQDEADMVMVVNNAGITGWNDAEAKKFVLENTKVPTGTCHDHIAPFVLVAYAKLGSEQGAWAAGTALQIVNGKSPKDIPIAQNEKGQLYVNMPLAAKLNAKIPLDTLKVASIVKD